MFSFTKYLPSTLVGLLAAAVRLLPFFWYGAHPLGYDTGFYRRYLIQPFVSFPNPPTPGLDTTALGPRVLLDILRSLGIPTDAALYGLHVLLGVAVTIALYYFLAILWNQRAAVLAAIFFALSPVQYAAYWVFLLKNEVGLVVFLGALITLQKRWYILLPFFSVLILFSHRTTSIVYLLTLAVVYVVSRQRPFPLLLSLVLGMELFVHLNTGFVGLEGAAPVAFFLTTSEYLLLSFPLLLAAVFVVRKIIAERHISPLAAFIIVVAAFPLLQLPFHERMFVFADVGVLILAAGGIDVVWRHRARAGRVATAGICVWLTLTTLGMVRDLTPLITQKELEELRIAQRAVPPDAFFLTTAELAPWALGWTRAHVRAPGMFDDPHSFLEWQKLWEGDDETKKAFFKSFPRPLYLFIPPEQQFGFSPKNCVSSITPFLSEYTCL